MSGKLTALWRKLRERLGWIDCPACGAFQRPRWVKDYLYHPEEPPLFGHWYMPCCGTSSPIATTSIADDAARSLGYRDGNDWLDRASRAALERE